MCAHVSIPRAMPLTTTKPARAKDAANLRATVCPYTLHMREPTMDMHGALKSQSPTQ